MNKKGFTLIELLLVVVLISILTGVVLSVINVSGVRGKTRDADRKTDLSRIQGALEIYFHDNRSYPAGIAWIDINSSSALSDALVPNYMDVLPEDERHDAAQATPCDDPTVYRYNYRTDGTGSVYILTAIMEVATSNDASPCASLTNWSTLGGCTPTTADVCYGVQNPF